MTLISRVLDTDAALGRVRIHHYDLEDEIEHIQTIVDVEPVVEAAKWENRQHGDYRPFSKGEWHKMASIPMALAGPMMLDGRMYDEAYMKKWLEDPDNAVFRTKPGKL